MTHNYIKFRSPSFHCWRHLKHADVAALLAFAPKRMLPGHRDFMGIFVDQKCGGHTWRTQYFWFYAAKSGQGAPS